MQYYPFMKKWYKIKPHTQKQEFQKVLVSHFNRYTYGRWNHPYTGEEPVGWRDSCDWRYSDNPGRKPAFWDYVCHGACHWLVTPNLVLAMLVEPNRKWRIITGDKHSTVWDGEDTLFDMNYSALGVDPNKAYELAKEGGVELEIGEHYEVGFANHFTEDNRKNDPYAKKRRAEYLKKKDEVKARKEYIANFYLTNPPSTF